MRKLLPIVVSAFASNSSSARIRPLAPATRSSNAAIAAFLSAAGSRVFDSLRRHPRAFLSHLGGHRASDQILPSVPLRGVVSGLPIGSVETGPLQCVVQRVRQDAACSPAGVEFEGNTISPEHQVNVSDELTEASLAIPTQVIMPKEIMPRALFRHAHSCRAKLQQV